MLVSTSVTAALGWMLDGMRTWLEAGRTVAMLNQHAHTARWRDGSTMV